MNSNEGKQQFFVVYQITNLIDGKIYVGIHTTYNVNDRYMGSSKYLKKDIKELGKQNFKKEILYIFDNKEDMIKMEAEIVNREFCHRPDTYNRIIGGVSEFFTTDMVLVKNSEGKAELIYKDDQRWLSGELKGFTKGLFTVSDEKGNTFKTTKDDPKFISGEYKAMGYGKVPVKDKNGNKFSICKDDPKYLSGELVHVNLGMKSNNTFWIGKQHSEETKQKMSEKARLRKKEKHSCFGTCWITNEIENKKIKKENLDEWLNQGWVRGRKVTDDFRNKIKEIRRIQLNKI